MKLKQLNIELQRSYSPNSGKYVATIEYEQARGNVTLVLEPEVSEALLAFIGPVITQFTHRASLQLEADIAQSVQEAKQMPAIEAPTA